MRAGRTDAADDSLPDTTNGKPKASARALAHIIERSSRIQGPAATAYVDRLRRANPEAAPSVIVAKLEKRYVAAVTASGAAVGSAAVLPGLGTLAALSAAAGETAVFLEATAFFALAIAAVHGIPTENRERRRALVLAVLVGDDSKHAIGELLGPGRRSGASLAIAAVHGIPTENRERRRALVLAVLVGDDSKHAIGELLGPGRRSGAWLS